jgi:hypothetical protein
MPRNSKRATVRDTVRDQLVMNDGHAQETLKALVPLMAIEGAIFRQGEGDALRGIVIRRFTQTELKAMNERGIAIPPGLVLPAPLTFADVQDFAEQHFDIIKFRQKPNSDEVEARPADFRKDMALRLIGSRLIGLRPLRGITYAPLLRSGGTIVAASGYDAETQLWLVDGIPELTVPEVPTRHDAETAMQRLGALLDEHLFEQDVDRIAAIAQLMTPALRGSMQRVPLQIADAAYPRTGKDYLMNTAALIGTGFKSTVFTLGETREEQQKRMGAVLLLGAPVILLSNLNGLLISDELAAYHTEGGCITRAYATTGGAKWAPNGNTIQASGNNIVLGGDLPERGLVSRQDANMEFPGERTFRGSPHDDVNRDRAGYLNAVFTIARWALRGADYQQPAEMNGFGGFDEFNRLIRGTLLALTGIDPLKRSQSEMQTARQHQPDRDLIDALTTLMEPTTPFCVRGVLAMLKLHYTGDGEADPFAILRQKNLPYRLRRARGRRGSTMQLAVAEKPIGGDNVVYYSLVPLAGGFGGRGDSPYRMSHLSCSKIECTLGETDKAPEHPAADGPSIDLDQGVDP